MRKLVFAKNWEVWELQLHHPCTAREDQAVAFAHYIAPCSLAVSFFSTFLLSTFQLRKIRGRSQSKGTIHPSLSLLPSANFFLDLNKSHHFLLKKSQNLIRQPQYNDSILIILHCWKILRIYSKLSGLNHCSQLVLLNSDFF